MRDEEESLLPQLRRATWEQELLDLADQFQRTKNKVFDDVVRFIKGSNAPASERTGPPANGNAGWHDASPVG
jgi:hypothetical protein